MSVHKTANLNPTLLQRTQALPEITRSHLLRAAPNQYLCLSDLVGGKQVILTLFASDSELRQRCRRFFHFHQKTNFRINARM